MNEIMGTVVLAVLAIFLLIVCAIVVWVLIKLMKDL